MFSLARLSVCLSCVYDPVSPGYEKSRTPSLPLLSPSCLPSALATLSLHIVSILMHPQNILVPRITGSCISFSLRPTLAPNFCWYPLLYLGWKHLPFSFSSRMPCVQESSQPFSSPEDTERCPYLGLLSSTLLEDAQSDQPAVSPLAPTATLQLRIS